MPSASSMLMDFTQLWKRTGMPRRTLVISTSSPGEMKYCPCAGNSSSIST